MKRKLLIIIGIAMGFISQIGYADEVIHVGKEYPKLGLILESENLQLKNNRENMTMQMLIIGGTLMASEGFVNKESKGLLFGYGGAFCLEALITYVVKSNLERETEKYIRFNEKDNISPDEREKKALETIKNIINYEYNQKMMSSFIKIGVGGYALAYPRPKDSSEDGVLRAVGIAVSLAGMYEFLFTKTNHERLLDAYNAGKKDDEIKVGVLPTKDGVAVQAEIKY